MKILLDCGAHNGDSIPDLVSLFGPFDKIYAFEANPSYEKEILALRSQYNNLELICAAVWDKQEKVKLFLGETGLESSLIFEKKTGGFSKTNYVESEAIDFSEWMKSNLSINDTIYLKMDIEGAEFPVLEKMIRDGTHRMVDVFLPEWHADRIDYKHVKFRRRYIELRFKLSGIKILRLSKKYLRRKGYNI